VPVSEAEILGTAAAQHEVFTEAAPSPEDVDSLRKTLAAGGIAVLARVAATGEPAGAGMFTVPHIRRQKSPVSACASLFAGGA
jgi:hypothetical protein